MADAKRKGPSIYGLTGAKTKIKKIRAKVRDENVLPNFIYNMQDGTLKSVVSVLWRIFYGIVALFAVIPKTVSAGADALALAARSLAFLTNVIYLCLAGFGLAYSYDIDTSKEISQDEDQLGLFILLTPTMFRLFATFILILFVASFLVLIFDATTNRGFGQFAQNAGDVVFENWLQDKNRYTGGVFSMINEQYLAPLRHHMMTLLLFSSIFIYFNEDLKTGYEDWLIILYIILVGVSRAILEVKHSRDARLRLSDQEPTLFKGVTLGDLYDLRGTYQHKPMRGPALLLGGTILAYNLWYGDGMDNGYSLVFNIALMAYVFFIVCERIFIQTSTGREANEFEWGYGDAWATIGLASTTMVVFSAMNLAERINNATTVEGALVAALGAVVLDISRLGYGMRSFQSEDQTIGIVASVLPRILHAVVGVIGILSVYADDWDHAVGVVPSLKLFVLIASWVKIVGFFYSFSLFDFAYTRTFSDAIVPLEKQNVENTLRQGSTIVLLLGSTLLKNLDGDTNGWGTALLLIAIFARLTDCIQDSVLEFGSIPWKKYIYGGWKDANARKSISSPTADNPRSWLVLGGLVTVAVILSDVINMENSQTEDYGDNNKLLDGTENDFNGWIITSLVLVLAHILLVVVSLFARGNKTLNTLSLSRIPLFRCAVTTLVLIGLAACAGVMNIGYNEVSTTSPSPSKDPFTPNWSQLHLLAGIVIYIFTDMIGHVFL